MHDFHETLSGDESDSPISGTSASYAWIWNRRAPESSAPPTPEPTSSDGEDNEVVDNEDVDNEVLDNEFVWRDGSIYESAQMRGLRAMNAEQSQEIISLRQVVDTLLVDVEVRKCGNAFLGEELLDVENKYDSVKGFLTESMENTQIATKIIAIMVALMTIVFAFVFCGVSTL